MPEVSKEDVNRTDAEVPESAEEALRKADAFARAHGGFSTTTRDGRSEVFIPIAPRPRDVSQSGE